MTFADLMGRSQPSLVTVLFTDIVGSTERAAQLGNSGWRELLAEHQGRVRREIRRFGGREANTAGDGTLATFDRPAPAIRCAWAIRETVRELGLDVRSGIHAGEVDGHGRDIGGLAVHIGARVAGEAGPGEILVTSTVREIETGAGFRFEDRGKRALKGVPGEWRLFALKGLPAGAALRTDRWVPALSRRRGRTAGAVVAVLVALVALWGVQQSRHGDLSPEAALASGAAPGIAVVPFRVTDPALEIWREGIVDLLSTNLDGAGGFRAIDSRTILARWGEAVPEGVTADLATSLDVASRTGAAYAVVGTAIRIGPGVRLTAEVYELGNRVRVGQAQVEGAPDSVLMLVDRLSIDVIRAILPAGSEDLPIVPHLASVTTASVPALKAYLEGEALYRRSDFREAIAAYDRAVQADSTFGLAYYRLAEAWGWVEPGGFVGENIDLALLHVDRLPPREATLVRANQAFLTGRNPHRALELLRQTVRRYPDDAEAWFLMGDTYVHFGPQILAREDGTKAFERAVSLDPTFAPFQVHLAEKAYVSGDSAAAAARMRAYSRAAPGTNYDRAFRLAFDLAYGDSATRARASRVRDTTSAEILTEAGPLLFHPRNLADSERLFRTGLERLDATGTCARCLFWLLTREGKLEAALALLGDSLIPEADRAAGLYHLSFLGLEIPDDRLEAAIPLRVADSASWFYSGAHAADRGRWTEHAAAVRSLEDVARRVASSDSVLSRISGGAAKALQGYGTWRRGRLQEALPVLEAARRDVVGWDLAGSWNRTIRWWLAILYIELDRSDEAVPYLESLWRAHNWPDPLAAYELGRIYAERGDAKQALDAYEFAIDSWREADPIYRPRLDAARRAVTRIAGAED